MKDLTLSPTHFCTSKSDYSKVKRVNVMMDPLSLPFKKGTKTSLERILLVQAVSRFFQFQLTGPVEAQSSFPTFIISLGGRINPNFPVSGSSTVKEYGISAAA